MLRPTYARVASLLGVCLLVALASPQTSAQTAAPWLDAYREPATGIIAAATSNADAWQRLAELTDTFGNRSERLRCRSP